MAPKKAPKRERDPVDREWLEWVAHVEEKQREEAHFRTDEHGHVAQTTIASFRDDGPWVTEWWLWKRFREQHAYYNNEIESLKATVKDLGLQVQGATGGMAHASAQASPLSSPSKKKKVVAIAKAEKAKIEAASEKATRDFLIDPMSFTEKDARAILFFRELEDRQIVRVEADSVIVRV
ncbi:hypothetical protein CYMTET_24749 [Cymbomonas tetramitiformis]|uniref:Uncharacterized protein n=1 Tax=Cymbomonas tetramitiformis TaxID=36881 RepID=A0AAE0FV51_9CHLO|nr:hypothetical protein CYMTET_24749 [Cymbomonas tetramitiformis]